MMPNPNVPDQPTPWKFSSEASCKLRVHFQEFITCTELEVTCESRYSKGELVLPAVIPSFVEVGKINGEKCSPHRVYDRVESFTVYLYSRNELGCKDASKVHHSPDEDPEPQDRWFRLVIPRYLDVILEDLFGLNFVQNLGGHLLDPAKVTLHPVPDKSPNQAVPGYEIERINAWSHSHKVQLGPDGSCFMLSQWKDDHRPYTGFSFLFKSMFSKVWSHHSRVFATKIKEGTILKKAMNQQTPKDEEFYALTMYLRPWQMSSWGKLKQLEERIQTIISEKDKPKASKPTPVSTPDQSLMDDSKEEEWKGEFRAPVLKIGELSQYLKQLPLSTLHLCPKLHEFEQAVTELYEELSVLTENQLKKLEDQLSPDESQATEAAEEFNKKQTEIVNKVLQHLQGLTGFDEKRQKELFERVEPDWTEVCMLVAANGQMDSQRMEICRETLCGVKKLVSDCNTPGLKFHVGCARANYSFLEYDPKQTEEDISEWLQRQNIHGGTLYAPTFKHQLEYWRQSDLAGVKQNQLKNSIDQLERFKYRFRHLMNAMGSKRHAIIIDQDKAVARKIVVLTDGLISDIQEVLNLLQDYRGSNMRTVKANGVMCFGGWDYNLLEINKYLNPEEPATTNSKQPNRKYKKMLYSEAAAVLKASERVEPVPIIAKELIDQIGTFLKIISNNLDIGGFGSGVEMHEILGRQVMCQSSYRSENLWMVHLIVRVEKTQKAKPPLKFVATKDVTNYSGDIERLQRSSPENLDSNLVNNLLSNRGSPYFCWMVAEKPEFSDVVIKTEQELIERAHQNLVARVLERDVLTRCAGIAEVLTKLPFFRQISASMNTPLHSIEPNHWSKLLKELKKQKTMQHLPYWLFKSLSGGAEEQQFSELFASFKNSFSKQPENDYVVLMFLQQLYFDVLLHIGTRIKLWGGTLTNNSFWFSTLRLVTPEDEELVATCRGLLLDINGFIRSRPSDFNPYKKAVAKAAPKTSVEAAQDKMAKGVGEQPVKPQEEQDITVDAEVWEDFDELVPPPVSFYSQKFIYHEPLTLKRIGLYLEGDPVPTVWFPTLTAEGLYLHQESPFEKHNRCFCRFFYRFRHTFYRLLTEGIENTLNRLLASSQLSERFANSGDWIGLLLKEVFKYGLTSQLESNLRKKQKILADLEKFGRVPEPASQNDERPHGPPAELFKYLNILTSVVIQMNREVIARVPSVDLMYNEEEITQFGKSLYEALWDEAYELEEMLAIREALRVYLSWIGSVEVKTASKFDLPTASQESLVKCLSFYMNHFKQDFSEPVTYSLHSFIPENNFDSDAEKLEYFVKEHYADPTGADFWSEKFYFFPESLQKSPSVARGLDTTSKDYRKCLIQKKANSEARNLILQLPTGLDKNVVYEDEMALNNDLKETFHMEEKYWHLFYGRDCFNPDHPEVAKLEDELRGKRNNIRRRAVGELLTTYISEHFQPNRTEPVQLLVRYPGLVRFVPLVNYWQHQEKLERLRKEEERRQQTGQQRLPA